MTTPVATPPAPAGSAAPPGRRPATRRSRVRAALVVAGILPSALVLTFTAKVALMLLHERAGLDHFADGGYGPAAGEFAANRSLNVMEPWIAFFDEGAALHADGELDRAVTRYKEALDVVPAAEECTVRVNLALAHEALGDGLARRQPDVARRHWAAGRKALADGGCPQAAGRGPEQTADAGAVDSRLREKLQPPPQEQRQGGRRQQPGDARRPDRDQQPGQQQRDQGPQPDRPRQQPPRGDPGERRPQPDPQQQELRERNQRGLEERQDYGDLFGEPDFSGEYQW